MKGSKRPLLSVVPAALAFLLTFLAAVVEAQEVRHYFVTDPQGSPVIATDAYGNVVWSEDYLPYGERRYRSASSGDNERWFTGAAQNEDTGLVDLGVRKYDPAIGRFLSIDPVSASGEQPFSVNRYAYANNNPYRYVDPKGDVPIDTIWDIGSVVYDLGKITVGWTIGNQALVAEGLTDAAADTAAMLIPYVPAGSTKIARMAAKGGNALENVSKVTKGANDFVEGYRAVSKAEADDIAKHGFRPDPNGRSMQDKWFSETREGAEKFRQNYSDLDEVVKAKIPKDVYDRSYKHQNIDNTGPGFCVSCDDLHRLK